MNQMQDILHPHRDLRCHRYVHCDYADVISAEVFENLKGGNSRKMFRYRVIKSYMHIFIYGPCALIGDRFCNAM